MPLQAGLPTLLASRASYDASYSTLTMRLVATTIKVLDVEPTDSVIELRR